MYASRVVRHAGTQFSRIVRAEGVHHERLRDRVAAILFVTIGVDLVCAVLAYAFEHDEPRSQIHSFGSALFWTTTQLLTVSSSLPNPISTGGRILDVFMEIWAVTVIATLAAAFGAFFIHRAEGSSKGAS